jgi:hypothetical protein
MNNHPSASESFVARTSATLAISEVARAVEGRVYVASEVPAGVSLPCVVVGEIVLTAPDRRMTVTVFGRDLDEAEAIASLTTEAFGWSAHHVDDVEYRRLEGKLTAATLTVKGALS